MKKKCIGFIWIVLFCCSKLSAQISIGSPNAEEWVKNSFGGQGIILGNITHKGNYNAIANFTSTKNVLKITNGLIISTGDAVGALGPNDRYNISKDFSNQIEHDKDLRTLEKGELFDVTSIEFDFVSFHNSIKFNYQFASDEYPEYVGSSFNDIFAFFVSDEKSTTNIAVIPGKTLPVSINTINNKDESALFINNNVFVNDTNKKIFGSYSAANPNLITTKVWNGIKGAFIKKGIKDNGESIPDEELLKTVNQDIYHYLQYDGITQKLSATAFVEPYKKYHLKIIIADVADNVYDSAVFLETRSFTANKDIKQKGFKDYPDYSKIIDPQLILQGKKLEDILPTQVKVPNTNIYFDFDKTEVSPQEMEKVKLLTNVYEKIKDTYRIEITGNTDSIGTYDYNYKLSKTRSEVVIAILQKNIPGFRVDAVEYKSFTEPNSTNMTEEGRKLNRRVSIKFIRIAK
jgi:outer membrane protein OmpA-like peptidoglycan-associated protein